MEPELVDCTQPEVAKELVRDVKHERSSVLFATNKATLHKLMNVLVGLVPPRPHDVGLRRGMIVGNDGQRPEHGLRDVLLRGKMGDPIDVRGLDAQQRAALFDDQLYAFRGVRVRVAQIVEELIHVGKRYVVKDLGQRTPRQRT